MEILGEMPEEWTELILVSSFPTLWRVAGLSGEFSPQIKKYFARCPTELFPEWPCSARSLLPPDAKPWVGFSGWEREVMWKRDVCPLDHSWSWNAAVGRLPRWHGKVFCWLVKQMNYCCVFPKWCFIFALFSWIKLSLFPTRFCTGMWRNCAWPVLPEMQKSRQVSGNGGHGALHL